ncbi:mediator complex subunit MED14-domain-containing protein [Paraphoma chrysanthemicola]|uniref:Mediator of RNA polymerase II transcription subunit 14 n=1 Tax=Paraphoma chrysanthemicola TaxID=798071 RepID=A0A8K0RIM4_9PLEO|nr:mediator complex subunit MED14-domain-containing protein [Paraphoma chrysanthemicola]
MNHDPGAASGSRDGDNKKRNFEGKLINGERKDAPGIAGPPGPSPDQFSELPPEIVHISSEAYHPLSTLLLRISQETYNELTNTLSEMAELQPAPQTNGVLSNGAGHGSGLDTSELNRRKKLLLMKFAQDNRAKFIKLLVLTEWGKKASKDVAKLIDLFAWAKEQSDHMDFVDIQIERIKLYASAAGERNPDIRTALEVLSTNKASWMPELGYIPPKPMSSEQGLKMLQYLNTSLSIRLNVHENLPRRLRHWRISSGRATFIIDNELEFDVVSFVEDTSEQWWFLDLRLLFSPAPTIKTNSHFYNHLKAQADFQLKEKGLGGLFDFLINFVLTHKVAVLRSQALALAASGWAGSLKVEKVHRELVVSYWTDRPGKKNWVEIGVSNNKPRNGKTSWRGPPVPSLTLRWFRQGKHVEDIQLDIDWHQLSFERIIKRVIAQHAKMILDATRENLNTQINVHAKLSASDPADCSLKVTLGTENNSTTLNLEPVTGNYILQPATALSARAESAFNQGREPKQIANVLTQLLAQTLRDLVHKIAQQLGWHAITRQSLHSDAVKTAVKLDVIQHALFSPRGWSGGWALAAIVDASGISWWIMEISSNGSAVDFAEQIKMSRPDQSTLSIDRSTLASLERVAVQLLSTRITTRRLDSDKKQFKLQYEVGQATVAGQVQRIARGWALYLHASDLLTIAPGEQPWLEPNLAIICQGLRPEGRSVWHIASGKMVKNVASDMQRLMAASPQNGFKFAEDGSFRILLSTPFGSDILGELRARLRDVNRLRSFATTLQKRQMRLGTSSLQRVQFQYGPSHSVAAVTFGAEREVAIEMSSSNPHYRVLKLLTELSNERTPSLPSLFSADANGLDRFCTTLVLTRPLMAAFNALEANSANNNYRNPAIHVHSLFKYRLTYENPVCTFDVRAQPKDDKIYWFIEDNMRKHAADLRPTPERSPTHRRLDNLQAKLKELFALKGDRWFGTRNGLVTEIDGVGEALFKLNECVLSCTMEGGYKAPPPLEVPSAKVQPQINAQQQANQQRAQQQARQQQQQQVNHSQQAQRRPSQQNQRGQGQMPNGRQQQALQNMQNKQNRPGGNRQDIIEID